MRLSWDTETALIQPALLAPPLTCGSFAWRDADDIRSSLLDHVETVAAMREHLTNADIEIVGANVVYDFGVLAEEDPTSLPLIFAAFDQGRVLDVQLRQKLIDNAKGELGGYFPGGGKRKVEYRYSLADLVLRHLKRDRFIEKQDPDAWRLRYGELRGVPIASWPEAARKYAVDDAVDTLLVCEAQEPDAGLIRDGAHQQRAHFALHLCSCWGVKTSPSAIRRLEEASQKTYDELTERLVAAGLVRASRKLRTGRVTEPSRDLKAARRRMVQVMAALGEPVRLTDKGEEIVETEGRSLTPAEIEEYASLNEEACRESFDPVLVDYAERTSITTVVKSHIPALWLGVDTPIQAHYEPILETGRTSCKFDERPRSEAKKKPILNGFQLQNPRRHGHIRECFIPRPGQVFGDYDFEQLELRTVAQVLVRVVGESQLARALNSGMDAHLMLGAQILGISYDEAKARRREPEVAEARQLAKVAGFGYPGGMQANGFRAYAAGYGIKLSVERAAALREHWLEAFPEYRSYFEWIRSLCEEGGTIVESFFSHRLRGRVGYTQACNHFFQSLGADAAKSALYAVSRACYTEQPCSACGGSGFDPPGGCDRCHGTGTSPLYGCRPWGFIHDQVLFEAPEEIGHEAVLECRDVMLTAANEWLPDVPLPLGEPVLSRCWSKDATPVWLHGRLQPWTEEIGEYRSAKVALSIAMREGRDGIEESARMADAWEKLDDTSRQAMEAE